MVIFEQFTGRVNLIDVSKNLNVEFNVISSLAQDIIKDDASIKLILGQLIDRNYVLHIAEEINEKLEQFGVIDVTELARSFDLPGDFIHSVRIIETVDSVQNSVWKFNLVIFLRRLLRKVVTKVSV